jgi:hypothetical protein
VVDAVGPAHGLVQSVPGQDIGLLEPQPGVGLERGEVGPVAGGEVVDDVDLVAARQVHFNQVRADEARTASDKNTHSTSPGSDLKPWSRPKP